MDDANVFQLVQPDQTDDPLTAFLRDGANRRERPMGERTQLV
jgi:hypothetical protein